LVVQVDYDLGDSGAGCGCDSSNDERGGGCGSDLWNASFGGRVICDAVASGKSCGGGCLDAGDLASRADDADFVGSNASLSGDDADH
jgi:hypothetical protein